MCESDYKCILRMSFFLSPIFPNYHSHEPAIQISAANAEQEEEVAATSVLVTIAEAEHAEDEEISSRSMEEEVAGEAKKNVVPSAKKRIVRVWPKRSRALLLGASVSRLICLLLVASPHPWERIGD